MAIDFPSWVEAPTPATKRTFSLVLPAVAGHRSQKIVTQFPNRPTVTVRHIETGRLHTAWADAKLDHGIEIAPAPIEEI